MLNSYLPNIKEERDVLLYLYVFICKYNIYKTHFKTNLEPILLFPTSRARTGETRQTPSSSSCKFFFLFLINSEGGGAL